MSAYLPPNEILSIFNQNNYEYGSGNITFAQADARYLRLTGGIESGLVTFNAGLNTSNIVMNGSSSQILANVGLISSTPWIKPQFSFQTFDGGLYIYSDLSTIEEVGISVNGLPVIKNGFNLLSGGNYFSVVNSDLTEMMRCDSIGTGFGWLQIPGYLKTNTLRNNTGSSMIALPATDGANMNFLVSTRLAGSSGSDAAVLSLCNNANYIETKLGRGMQINVASTFDMRFASNNVEFGRFNSSGNLNMQNGTALLPSHAFLNDLTSGMYLVGASSLGIAVGASQVLGLTTSTATLASALNLTISNVSASVSSITGALRCASGGCFFGGDSIFNTNLAIGANLNLVGPGAILTLSDTSSSIVCAGNIGSSSSSTGALQIAGGGYFGATSLFHSNLNMDGANAVLNISGTNGQITIANTAVSTSNSTGAIVCQGGVFIGKASILTGNLTLNGGGAVLSLSSATSSLSISGTTASSSNSTGCLKISGGLGITKSTNASSSTNGGSLTTAGGAAIAQDLYVGGNVIPTGNVRCVDSTFNYTGAGTAYQTLFTPSNQQGIVSIYTTTGNWNACYLFSYFSGSTNPSLTVLTLSAALTLILSGAAVQVKNTSGNSTINYQITYF